MSEEDIDPLIKRLKRQDKQIELLKAKLFTLQAALVRSSHFSTYDLDHPFASVGHCLWRYRDQPKYAACRIFKNIHK
ncbi:MAG: hypothetical protein FD128_2848 [Hyphomonadaceae bacterium]|nr:MAG: hypothetical protein FD128_2848 [Hyphomonadaceae bacterium]